MSARSLTIARSAHAATPSKQHKAFDTLVKKLERERARLQDWDDARASLSALIHGELPARRQSLDRSRKALVLHLDALYADARFNAADRGRMRATLLGIAEDILAVDADAELQAVRRRHGVASRGAVDAGMDDLFGFDPAQSVIDPAAERELEALAAELFGQAPHDAAAPRPAQSAAAPRRAPDAADSAQQLRRIYRRLASALHPDRESDPELRARNTDLLKRANAAYAQHDLYTLLSLQMEARLLDSPGLAGIVDAEYKALTATLRRQLRDTEAQVASIEFELVQLLPRPAARRITPQHVRQELQELAHALAGACAEIEDLLARGGETKLLKAWLREQDHARQSLEFEMDDAFAELLAAMIQTAPAKPPRRRR
ncbi:MAG: J domain-containing protein [Metallibacterium scheffleri]|uniref:J domain-containing protein n=1 Tax=Metallibacterium scheffleri TaxID=993689 RepID=UPI0026EDD3C3|nr:J domain-containing protein [Metallibacterium scheffleri]MCK9366260.1 J domain-containing protein [Metallibacterium scheffleri]